MATSVQVTNTLSMDEVKWKETVGPCCSGFNWWVNVKKADVIIKLPGAPEGVYFLVGLK
ncbi:hypothetical protein N9164_11650 [Draconibacterium sp.]|nr:hypothetical protein [Draconibacterium sp.]